MRKLFVRASNREHVRHLADPRSGVPCQSPLSVQVEIIEKEICTIVDVELVPVD